MIKKVFLSTLLAVASLAAQAQTPQPEIVKITFPQPASITALSDNGAWATACGVGDDDQSVPAFPYLVNAATGELRQLWNDDVLVINGIAANDVTDDGSLVAGSYDGSPAVCNTATAAWTVLPCGIGGTAEKITPDGRFIAGWGAEGSMGSDYAEIPLLWERQADGTYSRVDVSTSLTGFPTTDADGNTTRMVRIENISADGNIMAGAMNFIYPDMACYYVYNRTTGACSYIDNAMQGVAGGSFVDQSAMSNNGQYLTGIMQIVQDEGPEYAASYLYDTATGRLDMYNTESEEQDRGGFAVTNTGLVLASSPAVNPLRSAYVRYNSLWFGIDELMSSRYGINFYDRMGYDYTGVTCGVSDDEHIIAGMATTTTDGYIIRLGETLAGAASGVNPLETFSVSPEPGAQFASFHNATVTFNKRATLTAGTRAELLDGNGSRMRQYTITPNADGRSFTIGGMTQPLTEGGTYTLRIPAGAFTLTQDNSFASSEISVTYTGRANRPVSMQQVAPANGANVSELSTNSPVQMAFDTRISVAEGAVAYLYEDGNDAALCELLPVADGVILNLSPSLTRYLSNGKSYTVVVPAGTVTDINGDCGNEEIRLSYNGLYEPQFDVDGNLYFDDFNDPAMSMAGYLLYEGDHNNPTAAMTQLGFDADNNPWNFTIRDNTESDDYYAASHSMYSPAGTSDDWMSLPQLFIENADYHLSFDAQSYRKTASDRLEVIVLEEEGGYETFTDGLYEAFATRGVTIYDEQLSAGDNEETTEGEWQHIDLPLSQFAGKSIYIAFVNRNTNQSMVFLDNIRVFYNGDFYFTVTNGENVVAQESVKIGVSMRITGDKTYNNLTATLTGSDGTYTDTYTATGLNLNSGSPTYSFEFPGDMPLETGRENRFTVTMDLDGNSVSQSGMIRNLAFETPKHVVIEEGTGQWCGNCPLGILAFDNLERMFGDRVIPIAVHGGSGFDSYLYPAYNNYLGYTSWPMGRVNRIDTLYQPMTQTADGYQFSSAAGNSTFMDIAQRELGSPSFAGVNIIHAIYDTGAGTVTVNGNVAYSLAMDGVNHNIAFVVVENGLVGPQNNYFYSISDPNLGDFGAGGIYGQSAPTITFSHVARRVLGESYAGVSGLVPVSVSPDSPVSFSQTYQLPENVADWGNAEIVVMLIDANTGLVVNAAKAPFVTKDEAAGISDTGAADGVSIAGGNGEVSVSLTGGGRATVTVCDISGRIIATAGAGGAHDGSRVSLSTGGRSGLFIVKVAGQGVSALRKVIVK